MSRHQLIVQTVQITIIIVFKDYPSRVSSDSGMNEDSCAVGSLEFLDGCFDVCILLDWGALGFWFRETTSQALDLADRHTATSDSARELEPLLRIGDGK